MAMLTSETVPVPGLDTVTCCAALAVPTLSLLNVSELTDKLRAGVPVAVPVSVTGVGGV
jgi:hypothetical protein